MGTSKYENDDVGPKVVKIAGEVVAGLFVLATLWGSYYTVGQTERGVHLRNGAIVGMAEPGLGWKVPFIDSVAKLTVTTVTTVWDKPLNSYSADQQPADIKVSVTWHLSPTAVGAFYSRYEYAENFTSRIIGPVTQKDLKIIFGSYTAVDAITKRGKLNSDVLELLKKDIEGDSHDVVIESFQVENIQFSPAYEKSIEEKMLAEIEIQKLKNNAEREIVQKGIVETQADAQAYATRATAQAQADAKVLLGDAEGKAIKAKGDALKDNPELPALIQAEKWNGILPQTMVPSGTVPFLNVVPKAQ